MKTFSTSLVLLVGFLLPQFFVNAVNITNLNNLSSSSEFLVATGTDLNLSIKITSSSVAAAKHFFQPIWSGVLGIARGGTGTSTTPGSGQLLIGNGTGYVVASLIQGSNAVITNAAGSITVAVTSTPTFTSLSLTNPLAAVYGGTGVTNFSKGDILIAQNSTTLVRLPVGQDGQVLMASSSASLGVAWVTLATSTNKVEISDGSIKGLYHCENANDSSGNGNNFTNTNTTFTTGKLSNACTFDGSSSYLTVADNASLSNTGDLGLSMWVNLNTTSSGPMFLNKFDTTGNQRSLYIQAYNNSGFSVNFAISDNGTNLSEKKWSWNPSIHTWYHLVLNYSSAAHTSELFINGSSQGTVDQVYTSIFDSTAPLELGRYTGGPANYLDGYLDEVVYRSATFSASEINSLFNLGTGREVCVTAGCGN